MIRVKNYIDLSFCLVFLPVMIIIFPVERWFHNFPVYTLCAGAWLYAVYLLNRAATVPLLFGNRRRQLLAAAILLLSFIATYLIARVKLYEPKPSIFDAGITRRLPIVEQYQQCIWSLFMIVEFFSIAFGTMLEYAAARNRWLLKAVEEMQARQLLTEENERIKLELELSARRESPARSIMLKSGYQTVPVDVSEILVVETMENYVKVVRRNKSAIIAQTSMKAMEEMLGTNGFIRVHRSYIVARSSIESFNSRELRIATLADPIPVGRKDASILQTC